MRMDSNLLVDMVVDYYIISGEVEIIYSSTYHPLPYHHLCLSETLIQLTAYIMFFIFIHLIGESSLHAPGLINSRVKLQISIVSIIAFDCFYRYFNVFLILRSLTCNDFSCLCGSSGFCSNIGFRLIDYILIILN